MKKLFTTIVWAVLLAGLQGQEKKAAAEPNAYHIVFLDSQTKPLASATIVTKEFEKKEQKPKILKCLIKLMENSNTGKEVKWFKEIIPEGGERDIEIETKKDAGFGGGAGGTGHVMIDLNTGTFDSNIHVILNLDKKTPEGKWSYGIMAGGFDGGKVRVTRIRAGQAAATDKP